MDIKSDVGFNETIFVVDDNEAVRDSLRWLLEANQYYVNSFASAEEFLESYDPTQLGCLILDVRMAGMSGLELHEKLVANGSWLPTIFITGHGDVPMAVSTMKKGAMDFIEKPFDATHLLELIERILEKARVKRQAVQQQHATNKLLSRLTNREQQVLEKIIAGRLNKQIADDLDISIKTVEAHRANMMEKLNVNTVADLLRLVLSKEQ